jgi:hypothetical protein
MALMNEVSKVDDLISRAAAIEALSTPCDKRYRHGVWETCLDNIETAIRNIPAMNAAPVVHARWVKMTGMMPPEYHGHYECSNCAWHMKGLRNSWTREEELSYCPGCGAKMKGDEHGNSENP